MKRSFSALWILLTVSAFSCTKGIDICRENEEVSNLPMLGANHSMLFSITAEAPCFESVSSSAMGFPGTEIRVSWQEGANADLVSVLKISDDNKLTFLGNLHAPSEENRTVTKTSFSGNITGAEIGDNFAIVYPAIRGKAFGADVSGYVENCFAVQNTAQKKGVVFSAYAIMQYDGSGDPQSVTFTMASSFLNLSLAEIPKEITSLMSVCVSNINSCIVWKNRNGNFQACTPDTENTGKVTLSFADGVNVSYSHSSSVGIAIPFSSKLTSNCRQIILNDIKQIVFTNAEVEGGKYYSSIISNGYTDTDKPVPFSFTVSSDGRKVKFSPANIYCRTNAGNKLYFEAKQYDFRHHPNCNATSGASYASCINGVQSYTTPANTVGSFRWGSLSEAISTSTSTPSSTFFAAKGISVEGSEYSWRTLTGGYSGEWKYLLNERAGDEAPEIGYTKDARYAAVKVNNIPGILIFPDVFTWESGKSNMGSVPVTFNTYSSSWNGVNYTEAQFAKIEAAGAVFLPVVGYRYGAKIFGSNLYGDYWSSTSDGWDTAYGFNFYSGYSYPSYSFRRYNGQSVRLVRDVK